MGATPWPAAASVAMTAATASPASATASRTRPCRFERVQGFGQGKVSFVGNRAGQAVSDIPFNLGQVESIFFAGSQFCQKHSYN